MKRRQLWILSLLTCCFMMSFWLLSRYPDLGTKAEVGPEMILDGLGFEIVMPVEATDPLPTKVAKRTINWMKTNLKGMMFGLLIAACFQSMLGLANKQSTGHKFLDALLGVGVGAPMGLCVNCAAPISAALHKSGSRLETSLNAMLASPTLNVIVLGFLVTMLPPHLVMIKIVSTGFLLLVVVPFVSRHQGDPVVPELGLDVESPSVQGSWAQALGESLKLLVKNLGTLCLKLVPLMVGAGALGSLLITVVPFERLSGFATPSFITLLLTALIGTFLPIPMAFDVIICAVLYTAGVPIETVGVLLFTLGSYSIYSLGVVGQHISRSIAFQLFLGVVVLGVLSGKAAGWSDTYYRTRVDKKLLNTLAQTEYSQRPTVFDPLSGASLEALSARLAAQKADWVVGFTDHAHKVEKRAFQPNSPPAKTLFTREDGTKRGLEVPVVLGYLDHVTIPTVNNRSIAGGDIHEDGWADIVMANDAEVGGLTLFANLGGRFERQYLDLGPFKHDFITVCALVDLNNDGLLDLFFATINGHCVVQDNLGGRFGPPKEIHKFSSSLVTAAGFADIDRDGQLDIVLGTWVHLFFRTHRYRGWNYVALRRADHYELSPLSGPGGNTNAVLLSDLNDDGMQDLVVANDFRPADGYYRGNGTAHPVHLGPDAIERSTEWTMSLDSADLNNDLNLSLFVAHIAYGNDERARHEESRRQNLQQLLQPEEVPNIEYMISAGELHDHIRFGGNLALALKAPFLNSHDLPEVVFDALTSRYWRGDNRETWMGKIEKFGPTFLALFDRVFPAEEAPPQKEASRESPVPSSKQANVMLEWDGKRWADVVEKWGLEFTHWTWNAKFADLNLDGYQDLFLVNGSHQEPLLTPNLLYLNQQGKKLERVDDQGTWDYFPASNYTYIDLDDDGDLDIVISPPDGGVRTLLNNQQGQERLGLVLKDERAVKNGIGARVVIHYRGGRQLRELKASGGFNSFDAPVVWFGLGQIQEVDRVQIRWSDGTWTELAKPLKTGSLYRVFRLGTGSQNGSPG